MSWTGKLEATAAVVVAFGLAVAGGGVLVATAAAAFHAVVIDRSLDNVFELLLAFGFGGLLVTPATRFVLGVLRGTREAG